MQSALKSYGPTNIKRFLWNKEYSGDKWNFAANSIGDCVYPPLERYAAKGSILDLGCGTGNTANEMAENSYSLYLGVDISEACLSKATKRTQECGRAGKNQFASGDFLSYAPTQKFDVILFRESMYHVPLGKIKSTLDHYSKYLKDKGVFIVRLATWESGKPKARPTAMINIIEKEFDVVENLENRDSQESAATVIVFRPKSVTNK